MKKLLLKLIAALEDKKTELSKKKVTAGFDGFVDTIVRIIKDKKQGKDPSFFKTIQQFGHYITDKSGASFSLEIDQVSSRIGGNMPIMTNAMGHLGINVDCIGAMTHPVFNQLSLNCRVHSFAEPGTSTAYEFNDGKILLGNNGGLNSAGWEVIKNKIGLDTLLGLYRNNDLSCFVNWSEIDASTEIWKGLLQDVFPQLENKQLTFFDLSDCSKRSTATILEALMLLKEFSAYSSVALGLNQNESQLIYQALFKKKAPKEFTRTGEKIYEKLGIDTLVVHSSKESIGYSIEGIKSVKTFFVKNPAISTGAGDNFNAGFCTAALLGFDMELSLLLANAVAGSYVSTGHNHDLDGLIKFLQDAA